PRLQGTVRGQVRSLAGSRILHGRHHRAGRGEGQEAGGRGGLGGSIGKPAGNGGESENLVPTFHFELVSPEKLAFSGEVDQVDAPGAEGEFGVLAGHAPFISTLKPGVLIIYAGGQRTRFVISGGFAEINPQGM